MESPRGTVTLPARNRFFSSRGWVYAITALLFTAQYVESAQEGRFNRICRRIRESRARDTPLLLTAQYVASAQEIWFNRIRRRIRESLARDTPSQRTCHSAAGHTAGDNDLAQPEVAEDDDGGGRDPTEDTAASEHPAVAAYHKYFLDAYGTSTEDRAHSSCSETDVKGLDAIVYFIERLVSEGGPPRWQRPLFPANELVTMISARTSSKGRFQSRIFSQCPSVEDEFGENFTISPVHLTGESLPQTFEVDTFGHRLKRELRLNRLFQVESLHMVECQFRLKVIRDFVVRSEGTTSPPTSGERAENLFLLYSKNECTLMQLVHTIESHEETSRIARKKAYTARLSLTLQLVDVIGRINLKRVQLPRLSLGKLYLDASGTLYIQPAGAPRPEVSVSLLGRENLTSVFTEKWDAAKALLYIWCPMEARSFVLSHWTPRPDLLRAAESSAQCRTVPQAVRGLIRDLLKETTRVDEVRYLTKSYKEVELLLHGVLGLQPEEAGDGSWRVRATDPLRRKATERC